MCRYYLDWLLFETSENSDEPIWRKVEKTSFLAFLRGLRGIRGINIFPNNVKITRKSNERFSSNSVTDGRTDARTDERESLGLQRLRRETKNQTILMNQSEEKLRKHRF